MRASNLPPVRDHRGFTVWRVRVTTLEERTHRVCGEILMDGDICWTCGRRPPANELVRTIDFLREGEYELAH